MKELFEIPVVEIVYIDTDVICSSNQDCGGGIETGAQYDPMQG